MKRVDVIQGTDLGLTYRSKTKADVRRRTHNLAEVQSIGWKIWGRKRFVFEEVTTDKPEDYIPKRLEGNTTWRPWRLWAGTDSVLKAAAKLTSSTKDFGGRAIGNEPAGLFIPTTGVVKLQRRRGIDAIRAKLSVVENPKFAPAPGENDGRSLLIGVRGIKGRRRQLAAAWADVKTHLRRESGQITLRRR